VENKGAVAKDKEVSETEWGREFLRMEYGFLTEE